ncbi:MAG: methionyl-tRNA formyltransferase [Deltaproteobacteria bacterium]
MRIVFMGTPEFAVPCLEALSNSKYNVVAVITSPDKQGGRGMKNIIQSPVKKYAVEHNITVIQPINLKSKNFIRQYRDLNPDINIVIAFRMLPEIIWNYPQFGTYNLHASLLPKYRGAAPINRAIMNGETETGLTTFKLQHKIDTGSIAFQEKIQIFNEDNAGSLHDRMMAIGPGLVLKTLDAIENKSLVLHPQDDSIACDAPKIFSGDCMIDWNLSSEKVLNLIRGLSPYPGAWTKLDGKTFKIFKAFKTEVNFQSKPGKIMTDTKSFMEINCSDGLINLLEVQMEGKSKMDIKSFLNGYKPVNEMAG